MVESETKKAGKKLSFFVSLSFEDVSIPPFRDVLVLGKKCPHGKAGLSRCFHLVAPDEFELLEPDYPDIEAVLVCKRVLKRLPADRLLELLASNVFPYISHGEMVKVDLNIRAMVDDVEVKI